MAKQTICFTFIFAFLMLRNAAVLAAKMVCEQLPVETCAYAVASSGSRCVLETRITTDGSLQYECQSSNVMAEDFLEWLETEECINACGVERLSVGLSTDSLVETDLTRQLCSNECQDSCPNIFDLYSKLSAGEGVYLPDMCDALRIKSRKLIGGPADRFFWASRSVNTVDAWRASGPASSATLQSEKWAYAPASAPAVEP